MVRVHAKGLGFWLLCISFLITAPQLFGQSITGDILGTVYDSTGAVVAGAKITLTAVDTSISAEATSDDGGNYLFAQLKPGHYSVKAAKEGFQTETVTNIDLLVGQRPRVDVTLQLGSVTQTVEVSAGGVQLLDTQTSTVGEVMQEKPVQQLPLNGRNFMQLAVLSPGVAPVDNAVSPATTWVGQGNVTTFVEGLRESNESFLVDGIESRNPRFGSVGLRASPDAIQEFKMQTSSFSAEFGRSSAIINTTLKSGTNTLHGSAYEFIRNSSLDSNDYFLNSVNAKRPEFQQNNFGFSLGGPVVIPHLYHGRDKTFFFMNYEGLRSRLGITGEALVPSDAQWQGNLADDSAGTGIYPTSSAFCQANGGTTDPKCRDIIDPTTIVRDAKGNIISDSPFPGNVIPTARLNATSLKWKQFSPSPNVGGLQGISQPPTFNYTTSPKDRNDMNQGNARLDHALTSKDQLFGSFSFEDRPHISPSAMPLQGTRYPLRNQLLAITEAHTFSPTVVNEARFGYNRTKTFLVSLGALGTNYAANLFGLTNTSGNPFDFGVPDAGFGGFSTIGSFSESIGALDQDYQIVDNLSIVHGKHNVKLGLNFIHEKFYQITDFGGIPSLNFDGRYTQTPGVGLGDFLLGNVYQATASVGDSSQNLRANWWAGYLQDDWRLRPNLTLNIGIRYEHSQTPYDTSAKTQWFDPAVGRTENSRTGAVRNGIVDPNWHNFAPRVGFAYSPGFLKNTSLRGSYGIFYATDNWNELQFLVIGPDFYTSQTLNSDPVNPTLTYAQLFPTGSFGGANSNPFSVDKRNRTPYVSEWSMDLQHTFASNWVLDVGYLGNMGQKLPQRDNENIATPDPTGTVDIKTREPFPAYSWILLTYNGGWSNYNGMTARLEKRLSSGMYILGSYTWSHGLDLGGTDEFSASSALFKKLDKGNDSSDVRQRLVLSYIYELPFGPGKKFLNVSGPGGKVVGGWQVNGITTFSTGQYFTAGLPTDWANLGAFSQARPNQEGDPYPANKTINEYWNITPFVFPGCPEGIYQPDSSNCPNAVHVQGNAARDSLLGPGHNNWDLSLTKNTKLSERTNLEIRGEFFNAWNHSQFGVPNTGITPGQFGRISSMLQYPREIQIAMRLTW